MDISFTTFLKISSLSDTSKKISETNGLFSGGQGYDYYKNLKRLAPSIAKDETSIDEFEKKISSLKREAERNHNLEMAKQLRKWTSKLGDVTILDSRPSGLLKPSGWKFGIRMKPELAYLKNNTQYVTYLWATKSPVLSKKVAGMGVYLLKEKLAKSNWINAKFQIYDLRKSKVYDEALIDNATPILTAADLALLNSIWPE